MPIWHSQAGSCLRPPLPRPAADDPPPPHDPGPATWRGRIRPARTVKVAHDATSVLALDARPVALAAGIGALLVILLGLGLQRIAQGRWGDAALLIVFGGAMGLGALWAFVRREQVRLDRATGQITFTLTTLLGKSYATRPLPEAVGARVQTRESRDRRKGRDKTITLYRPVLVLQDGAELPLTEVWTADQDGPTRVAGTVTRWLEAG